MRGFPRNLNTKEDYQYIRDNFPREQWVPHWQALLDTCKDWFFVRTLNDGETAPAGGSYMVVPFEAREGADAYNALYELRHYDTCKLYLLGFTEAEVQATLAETNMETKNYY